MIEIQGRKLVLKAGQWSRWTKLDFTLRSVPSCQACTGICRFYLQEVAPILPALCLSDQHGPGSPRASRSPSPSSFVQDVSGKLGPFATTGFQEDYTARKNGVFSDDEYARQADMVLEERLALLDYAVDNYEDGLLFFYFSSSDLQSHMFWWDSDETHPIRSAPEAKKYFEHVQRLYRKLDQAIGELMDRYGSRRPSS